MSYLPTQRRMQHQRYLILNAQPPPRRESATHDARDLVNVLVSRTRYAEKLPARLAKWQREKVQIVIWTGTWKRETVPQNVTRWKVPLSGRLTDSARPHQT
jgi:hypothetical protein